MKPRPIRIEGDVAYVTLSKGYVAIIDASDVPIVDGKNWHASVKLRPDGSIRTVYARRQENKETRQKPQFLHRVIAGTPDGLETDHIDGDGLNNRRKNLRPATTSQNQHNRKVCLSNTSGVKGVWFGTKNRKWRAAININGRSKNLGYFTSKDEAAAAYASASRELHGDFGRTE